MGRDLYRTKPPFRESIDVCGSALAPLVDFDLAASFRDAREPTATRGRDEWITAAPDVDRTEYMRSRRRELVRLGVLQIALCDLWRSVGVAPQATLGISLGEVGAAYAADALSREDAAIVVCAIADAVSERSLDAVMFSVCVDCRTARELCDRAPGALEFLGTLERELCLMLCPAEDGPAVSAYLAQAAAVKSSRATPWSYHTPRGVCDRRVMEDALVAVSPKPQSCPIYSAAAGQVLVDAKFDSEHWYWVVSRQFFYHDAVTAALDEGPQYAVSIGPHPEQRRAIQTGAEERGLSLSLVDSMREDEPELATWARAVRELRQGGVLRRNRPVPAPGVEATGSRAGVRRRPSSAATLKLDDPATAQDPFSHYEDLRRDGSVHYLPHHDAWLVLGYDDVLAVFRRPQLYSSRLIAAVDPVLLGSDGRPHAAVRRALAGSFSAEAVQPVAAEIGELATRLLAPLAADDELEVVRGFASPLAYYMAARLLALDEQSAAAVSAAVGDAEVETVTLFDRVGRALEPMIQHSGLAAALGAEHGFDDAEVFSLLRVLWIAATSTTKRVIASSIRLLAEDAQSRGKVIAEPALLGAFIDESIRLHPPELLIGRVTTETATLGGAELPPNSMLQLCLGAANRDPSRFENPSEVRLDRGAHLAFGSGSHGCPGERLARAVTHVALSALLRVAPDFGCLQPRCMLRYLPAATTHGLEQLVIRPAVRASAPASAS